MPLPRKIPFTLLVSIALFSSGCGGGSGSSGGGGGGGVPPPPSTANEWTWMSGSDGQNAKGVYGTQGAASAANVPGARFGAASWVDSSGDLWLFGGWGNDSSGTNGSLNDLWKFSPKSGQWTWVGGSNLVPAFDSGQPGTYGTLGTGSASNTPGGRYGAVSWTDSSGNLWLFGGSGYDANGTDGNLNDLWEFNTTTSEWAWASGSNTANAVGVYGTQGVASTGDIPGARSSAVSWIDGSGNLWLFGGVGFDDLWKFTPTNKEWTWVSGANTVNASGVYGTQGTAAAANVPGARSGAVSWIDGSGNLWLFGGSEDDSPYGGFNDLWKFDPTSKEWTWISGSNTVNATGVYGTKGVASAANVPGARFGAASWIDGSGNLWVFGGHNCASGCGNRLNDLWEFSPKSGQWTWVGGAGTTNASGVYGTQGVAAAENVPSAREQASGWIDGSGSFWLFGGFSPFASGGDLPNNDLWRYQP